MGDPDAGRPHAYGATTDFDRHSHDEMLRMVENANPAEVTRLGRKLRDAEATLNDIGGRLKTDMTRLVWESEAGEAFRDWGHRIAVATESLADFSGTVGRFIEHAGEVLAEVQKAMPKVSTEAKKIAEAHTLNPMLDMDSINTPQPGDGTVRAGPTPKQIHDARAEVEEARQQAVTQMIKLAQAYNMSTDILKSSAPPAFPPTPEKAMPGKWSKRDDYFQGAGAEYGDDGSGPDAFSAADRTSVPFEHPAGTKSVPATSLPGGVTEGLQEPVGTQLDAVAAPPARPDAGTLPVGTPRPRRLRRGRSIRRYCPGEPSVREGGHRPVARAGFPVFPEHRAGPCPGFPALPVVRACPVPSPRGSRAGVRWHRAPVRRHNSPVARWSAVKGVRLPPVRRWWADIQAVFRAPAGAPAR